MKIFGMYRCTFLKKLSLTVGAVFFTFFLFFVSCTNTVPQIFSQKTVLLFDYTDGEKALPRLCVFLQPSEHFQRIREITVENPEKGLIWRVTQPSFVGDEKNTWVGSAFLVNPAFESFPPGTYRITLINYDDKRAEIPFVLDYPPDLPNLSSSGAVSGKNILNLRQEFLTIYNKDKKPLFFGPAAQDLSDFRQIREKYPEAIYTQKYIESANSTYGVLLPLELLE